MQVIEIAPDGSRVVQHEITTSGLVEFIRDENYNHWYRYLGDDGRPESGFHYMHIPEDPGALCMKWSDFDQA